MWYAVIDTNVLVSALLKPNSIPRIVIDYVYAGYIVPLYNDEIIAEYVEVLHRDKFNFKSEDIDTVINKIIEIGQKTETIDIDEIVIDPKDIVFYAVTLNGRTTMDSYLITGNIRHYPSKTFIVTPRQMLEIMGVLEDW